MAEWWEQYTAQPAPKASSGNWWDAFQPDFGNVESGVESRPSFAGVQSGVETTARPLMSSAQRAEYQRLTEAGVASGEIPRPIPAGTQFESRPPTAEQILRGSQWGGALNDLTDSPVAKAIRDNPLIRGFEGRLNEAAAGANLLTAMPVATAVDALRGDNAATDYAGQMIAQHRARAAELAAPADAPTGQKVVQALGSLAFDLPTTMASKPLEAASALPRFLAATDTAVAKQLLGDAFKEAAMTARIPATASGMSTALSVIDNGGTPDQAIKAGLAEAAGTVGNFALPLNIAGNLPSRLAQGAGANVAGEAAQNALVNQFLPADQQRELYDPEQMLISAAIGAPMAGVLGEPARQPARVARAAELTNELAASAGRIRTPESDAVDAGRETARAIFAEADAAARPDPATIDPERKPEKTAPTRLAELEAKPEPTLFEREEMALLQEGKPFDRQALLADLESAPEPELIRNGTRVFYPGDVKAMRAKLAEAGLSEGMRMTGEDGSDAGLYFPAKMQAEVDAVLRPSKPSAPTGTEAAELDATIEAPVAAAKDAMAALQALNPQLANELRVEALSDEEMDSRPANTVSGKGAGAGRNGSVINLKKIGATFSEVKEEIRHMVDTLLGGGQVAKWIDEDAGMQRRVRDFLNGRHKLGDLAPNTRYDDGAEIAQSLLDQYFRNPDAVREALPDMATFLEQMGADKYRPVMDALAEAEKTNASREPVRARETAAPVETTPAAPYQGPAIPPPKKQRNQVRSTADFDPNYHDIRDFIALHGGLDAKAFAAEFNSEVPSPAENFRFFGKPLFRKSGGLQPDQLRELLQETGFLNPDSMDGVARYTPQDAYDLVDRALDGQSVYHPAGVDVQNAIKADEDYYAEQSKRQAYIDENGSLPDSDEQFARRAEAGDRGDLEMLYAKRAGAASTDMFGGTERRSADAGPRPAQTGLFAEPTASERNTAEADKRDAERNGLGRDLVRPEQGRGDLFAGPRPKQEILRSQRSAERILPNEDMGTAPLGAWVRGKKVPGVRDADLFQVMDVPLDRINAPELDSADNIAPERRLDAEDYTKRLRNGEVAPNARGYELPSGLIKLADGHRRMIAARNAGRDTLRIAVSPIDQEGVKQRLERPDTQGIEVDEAADLTPEEMAAFNRQVDTGRGQRETPPNDLRTSPSNADARRDGARRTVEDQGGRSGQPVPVQDGTFAPDASLDASSKPPKFPRWFRQSKLKNPKGIPLEFNHTTNADFDTFDSSRRGSNTGYAPSGLGNWFSQSVEGYGSKKLTGNIRMENPKVMPLHKLPDLDTQEDFAAYADKLRDQGFDGIYFPDVKQAVTFDSVQFKENDNTEYSESPNIYKSKRNDDAKIFDDSGDYSSTEDMVEGVRNGDLLVHFRVKDGTDFQYGIDPSAGEFLRSTEAWQESESEHGEGPELTFFAENFNWGRSDFLSKVRKSDGNIEAVFVRKNDTLQKSLGNGRVLGGDGKESSYEMSRMADYESPLFRGEPAGVETGDWYTEKSQDVVGVASAESVKAAIETANPSILKSAGKQKSAPKRLSDAEVAKAKADAESRVASHWGRSAVNKLKTRGRVEFITKQEVVDRGLQTMAELDGVDGFFDPESGKAYVIADSGAQSADLPGVLSHEVFHANAEQFLGTDGFKRLKEAFRKLKSRDKDIAAAYKRVPGDTAAAHVDEEGLAYLAQEAPKHRLSERLTDEAKLFLNRLGIPLDWLNAHAAAVRKIAALNLKDAANRGGVVSFNKDGVKYQKVFHGTPHRGIEKTGFSLQKIGTGEGAQAYGYGMYFAGNKDIAEHYRNTLSSTMADQVRRFALDEVEAAGGDIAAAIDRFKRVAENAHKIGSENAAIYDRGVAWIEAGMPESLGQLYHAEIPEDSDLLDWDKPLSEQPEKVRKAVAAAHIPRQSEYGGEYNAASWPEGMTGGQWYGKLASALSGGRADYNAARFGAGGGQRAASEYLQSIGIPGLRYRDGGSRGQGQMSYQDGLPAGFKYEKDQSGVGIKNEKGLWLTTGHRSEADAHRNLFGPRPSHNYVIWDETLLTPEKAQITPYYSKRDKPKPKVTGARPEELIEVRKQISSFRTLIKCLGG